MTLSELKLAELRISLECYVGDGKRVWLVLLVGAGFICLAALLLRLHWLARSMISTLVSYLYLLLFHTHVSCEIFECSYLHSRHLMLSFQVIGKGFVSDIYFPV